MEFIPHPYDNPPELPSGTLNIYTGFGVSPVNHGITYPFSSRLLQHAFRLYIDWVLDWLAWNYQNPHRKIECSLILQGDEGTGKGTIGRVFMRLWGNHAANFTQASHVVGNFNSHHEYLKGVVATEACFAGDKQTNNALKGLITDYESSFEAKGRDVEVGKLNYINLMMTTNMAWCVPADIDSRRYAIFKIPKHPKITAIFNKQFEYEFNGHSYTHNVGDDACGSYPECDKFLYEMHPQSVVMVDNFYAQVNEEISNVTVLEQILYDLLNRKVNKHPKDSIPTTQELIEQRLLTLKNSDSVFSWLLNTFDDEDEQGVVTFFESKEGDTVPKPYKSNDFVPNSVLIDSYDAYCKKQGLSAYRKVDGRELSNYLNKFGNNVEKKKSGDKRGHKFFTGFKSVLLSQLG